jgi:hypothetical protein
MLEWVSHLADRSAAADGRLLKDAQAEACATQNKNGSRWLPFLGFLPRCKNTPEGAGQSRAI